MFSRTQCHLTKRQRNKAMSDYSSSKVKVKARSEHRCCWCGETIEKGETYYRWFCVFEGSANTLKMHPECEHAESKLYIETDEHEWDDYSFTRGCVCDSGDEWHGTYPSCQKIKALWAAAQAQPEPARRRARCPSVKHRKHQSRKVKPWRTTRSQRTETR